jgi:hypothetical protein
MEREERVALWQGAQLKDADILAATFIVSFRERDFTIIANGNRVDVFATGETDLLGTVRRGSPRSGAIWVFGECIAEYDRDNDSGCYMVVPIEDGFKRPDASVEVDPLFHLLRAIHVKPAGVANPAN